MYIPTAQAIAIAAPPLHGQRNGLALALAWALIILLMRCQARTASWGGGGGGSPVNLSPKSPNLDKIATETLFVGNDSHSHPEQHQKYRTIQIEGFTVTSYAVSRGHPAPLVGKRFLAGGLRVYFCLDSCLVYINFAHTQDHDYVLYLCGGTSGIV